MGNASKTIWIHVCLLTLLVGLFSWQWTKHSKKFRHEFMMRKINQALPPSFAPLIDPIDLQKDFVVNKLASYVAYAQRIVQFVPRPFDAYGLLGFCYYYQGRIEESVESFKKAVEINPVFLPSYYNLGVIYWNLGDHQTARAYFEDFLTRDALLSKKQLMVSKFVYKIILMDVSNPDLAIEEHWKEMWQISQEAVANQKPLSEKLSLSLF